MTDRRFSLCKKRRNTVAQDLSFEMPDGTWFITTKTIASLLWLVNNAVLEEKALAYLAKYQEKYGVILYACIFMGNHWHIEGKFPNGNKTAFLRSFNSMFARLVAKHVKEFHGGRLWGRRARAQLLPENADVEHSALYIALNPVSSGLTQKYTEYKGYNSFSDAICGRAREFDLVDWTDYNNKRRKCKNLKIQDFTTTCTLTYTRLPGYENLSQKDYRLLMLKKIEERRQEVIAKRVAEGKGFAGVEALEATKPGDAPRSTKKSDRNTKRPLVLTLNPEARAIYVEMYFSLLAAYKEASRRFRSGELDVPFPPGTHRPPLFCPC